MIKKILIGLCALILLSVTAIAGLVGLSIFANNRADEAAKSFCGSIPIGSDIGAAVSRAARNPNRNFVSDGTDGYRFTFQGGMYHAGVCLVGVSGNKVVSVRAESQGDE